jgi:hypothetical protein
MSIFASPFVLETYPDLKEEDMQYMLLVSEPRSAGA